MYLRGKYRENWSREGEKNERKCDMDRYFKEWSKRRKYCRGMERNINKEKRRNEGDWGIEKFLYGIRREIYEGEYNKWGRYRK